MALIQIRSPETVLSACGLLDYRLLGEWAPKSKLGCPTSLTVRPHGRVRFYSVWRLVTLDKWFFLVLLSGGPHMIVSLTMSLTTLVVALFLSSTEPCENVQHTNIASAG